jgi:hypothetical protein
VNLDWRYEGRVRQAVKRTTDFLDEQVFAFPKFAIQIAGLRGGVVGLVTHIPKDSTAIIIGSLDFDGSLLHATLDVQVVVPAQTPTAAP